jgi:hypothetical protein
MNQTASKPSPVDHGFNTFMLGLTIGVLGALLLGTEEGRKLTKEAIDGLPEGFKKVKDLIPKENVPDFAPPLNSPEETPHHMVAEQEAPPPPPPHIHPSRPEYFYSSEK